jgi:hypothetical protein
MATEELLDSYTFLSGIDLSAYQYYGVKMYPAGGPNSVTLVSAPTDTAIGILQDHVIGSDTYNPTRGVGRGVAVGVAGGSKVVCGGTLAIGDRFNFDATGRAVTTTGSGWSMGWMREAGSIGTIASCVIDQTGQDAFLGALPNDQYSAVAGNTPLTLTGPQYAGALDVTVQLTAALAGAGTVTTPTAVAIVAAIANPTIGETYKLRIVNTSSGAFAWTQAAGTGVTLTGTQTIAQNTWRDFLVTLTSLTAVAVQATGATGTAS